MPHIVGNQPVPQPEVEESHVEQPGATQAAQPAALDETLEPLRRRMERVRLSRAFVASLLVPGAALQLTEVAMRWAGMPNKNERAAMHEVLDTLTSAGYLERSGEESWMVLKSESE